MTAAELIAVLEHAGALQLDAVERWHAGRPEPAGDGLAGLVLAQHAVNFRQWHAEDICRAPDAGDAQLAAAKRTIDRLNGERHVLVERIDDELLRLLEAAGAAPDPRAPLNSESPGSIVDRCSILALREWHRGTGAGRCRPGRPAAPEELALISAQRRDLLGCLAELLDDVAHGRRRFRVYRHLKSYVAPAAVKGAA